MRRIYVEIPENVFSYFAIKALYERRAPREQIGWELEQVWRQAELSRISLDRLVAEVESESE